MTEFTFGAYRLLVDVEATRAYYAAHNEPWITCDCAGCRNFAQAVKDLPRAIRDFFDTLGLDPEKVQELCYYNGSEQTISGSSKPGDYQVFPVGWVDITKAFSVGFKNECELLPEGFPHPCCQMQLNFTLPWGLEEPNPYVN